MSTQEAPLPAHVPPELAMLYPLTVRTVSTVNPHKDIVPKIHQGPPIFWATNVFPGPAGGWVVRRAEDLKQVYENTSVFIKKGNAQMASMIGESWDVIPTELDPPRHTMFRRALEPVFSPRSMAKLESKVSGRARHLIDNFKDKGEVEFIGAFATQFPVSIVLDMMGLPQDRMDEFLQWEFNILHTDDLVARKDAIGSLKNFLMEEIEKRKQHPAEDMITSALSLEVDGRKWSTEEVFGFCFNLFVGGLDTVTANLGFIFHHLATHPEHQQELRDDPSKVGLAIQELMRAYAAVTTMRICDKETTIHGVTIKPGDRVAMSTTLGSNDPEAFESPQEVRLDRRPVHLSLGHGIHRCLGAHLARRELNVAITDMLELLPEFRLKPGFEVPFLLSNVLHIQELQLVWD
jgi:cytochrome P450